MGHSVPLLGTKVAHGIEARWNAAMCDALVDLVKERPSTDDLEKLVRCNPERWIALFIAIEQALYPADTRK